MLNERVRKNNNIVFLIAILFLLLLTNTSVGRAQKSIAFSHIEIDLWPEFDQPSMLVIYRMTLKPTVSLPFEVRFRIPSNAGQPNAVAGQQPDRTLINIPFTQELQGDWNWIVFQATTPDLQIEYYDPDLIIDGNLRHYEYTWMGDYEVDALNIEVQQPAGASKMEIIPELTNQEVGTDGLNYYHIEVGSLVEDQQFQISIDYLKDNEVLSFENLPIEPSEPLDGKVSGKMSINTALPYFLGLLGIALLVGGGIWYWRSGQKPIKFKTKDHQEKIQLQRKVDDIEEDEFIYCHRCGKRASFGDRFCRSCGTELKK
jgi:hypothetical protein